MPQLGFEPTISAGERPLSYALDRVATGTGICLLLAFENYSLVRFQAKYFGSQ